MATQNTKATRGASAQAHKDAKATADINFEALTLEDAPVAALKRSRTTILDKSPVLSWLRQSFEQSKAKAVTVPTDQAQQLERLLRSGVDRLTAQTGTRVGVAVTLTDLGNGNTKVSFLAKERRAYSPRKKTEKTA